MSCAPLHCGSQVLVIVRVPGHTRDLVSACNEVGQHDDVLEPELSIDAVEDLAHLGIGEGPQYLVDDLWGNHEVEARAAQESLEHLAWSTAGLDDGADVDVRVEDSPKQGLLDLPASFARPLAGGSLRLERDFERLVFADATVFAALEDFRRMPPRESAHLLQSLHRYERGQRLAFALDDELIVPESDAVEEIPDPLANLDCGDLLGHGNP